MTRPEIDWSEFDQYPQSHCYCVCGNQFLSHAKLVRIGTELVCISRKPCPKCKGDGSLRKVSNEERESITIRKEDVK